MYNPVKLSGRYMYHQFNIQQFYVLPTQCSVWISEQTAIISLYSINWLVFGTETQSVYSAVRTGYWNVIWVICFIWIWEQTAIISLYNINWLVCITKKESVYCAVRTETWDINQVIPSLKGVVQWLSRLVAGLSPRRPHFSSKPIDTYGGQRGTGTVLPLSVFYHQCPTVIFIFMSLLPEGQRSEAWEPSNKRV